MWKFLFSLVRGKMRYHCQLVYEKLAFIFDQFRHVHKF